MSPYATLIDLLSACAQREPEKVGLIFLVDGEEKERLTYGALARRACALAARLQESPVMGERALLLLPSGLDFVVAFFGALYAGMIAVPAYPPNPTRVDGKTRRLQAMVKDAEPSRILTTALLANRLQPFARQLFGHGELIDVGGVEESLADRWTPPPIDADATAFLQYTSGSTALPKGVMVSHRSILHNERMIQARFARGAGTTVVSWLPQYHDMGLIGGLLQPIYSDSLGVFMSPSAFLQQPIAWLKAISRYRAHTSGGPNFAYDLILSATTPEQRAALDLSSWRVAFNGAEPVRLATIDRFSDAFAPYGFHREAFFPCYGLAEATLIVAGRQGLTTVDRRGPSVSCGPPVIETEVVIVDPVMKTPCDAGQVGEIWIQGAGVAAGYWRQPEETAQTFGATLTGRSGTFLRSGDLGQLVDGELIVAGRLKDLIIIRGENHYPEDLEATAADSHAALRFQQGAAFTVEIGGVEELIVVHAVERAQRDQLDEAARAIREGISQQHGVRVYTVVLVDASAIPRTSSGKVQRYLCRTQYLENAFPTLLKQTVAAADAPQEEAVGQEAGEETSELARALRQEIASVMRLLPAQLSDDRPLSAWGLDSLMAAEIHHRLRQRYHADIPMARLLGGMTLPEIGLAVLAARQTPVDETRVVEPGGLSIEQQRLWMLSQIAPDKAAYNVSAALPIAGPLDPDRLRRAVAAVVRRHDILRATVQSTPAGPVLRVAEPGPNSVAWNQRQQALAPSASRAARDLTIWHAGLRHAETPFDLAQGPLLRFELLILGAADAVLLVCAHHLVLDAESFRILFEQLAEAYRSASDAGEPVPWRPWSVTDARTAQHVAYWRQQLASVPEPLDFSGIAPGQTRGTESGALKFSIPAATLAGLRELGHQTSSTLFMLLLSAWHAAFHRWTGRRDWLSATPVVGRPARELHDVMGSFAYPLLLRATVAPELPLRTLIETTRASLLRAYDHQDLELTRVIESLRGEHRSSRVPLVQMLFSVLKMPEAPPDAGGDAVTFGTPALIRATTDIDLFVTLAERPDALDGTLCYRAAILDEARVRRLVDGFITTLDALIRHPEWTVADVPQAAALPDTRADAPPETAPDALQIAVAASFVVDPLQPVLEFWSRTLRTPWTISTAPPGQVMQQLIDPRSLFAGERGGLNILLLQPTASGLEVAALVDAVAALQRRSTRPLIVAICPEREPAEGLDAREGAPAPEGSASVSGAGAVLTQKLAAIPGVHVLDAAALLRHYPVDPIFDEFSGRVANLPFADELYIAAGTALARTIRALTARPCKVIVVDCDHTLWNGVCAEDGPDQVRIDPPQAALQHCLREQQRAGVLLCLASKNSEMDVKATFAAHPTMPLAWDDFAATRISWQAKSEQLVSLAAELDLGLDSFIYIDDNPLECAEVESRGLGVLTLCVSRADDVPRMLEHVWAFDRWTVTDEDRRKTRLYRQVAARRALEHQPPTLAAFIAGLDLQIAIAPPRPDEIARVAQLSARVNQFNVSMRRYTEAEIAQRLADRTECLVARVRDRFGDYGLVGAVVFEARGEALRIESFLLSCRALGRGVEYQLLNAVGARASSRGVTRVEIDCRRGPRNTPALAFMGRLGAAAPIGVTTRTTITLDAAFAAQVSIDDLAVDHDRAAAVDESTPPSPSTPATAPVPASRADAAPLAFIATHLRSVQDIAAALRAARARPAAGSATGAEPTTAVERTLARIWEEMIGVPITDVSQDLFALGGDSLLAVRILGRIHETFQIELSLDELFLGPLTVRGVGEAIEKAMLLKPAV